MKKGRDYRQAIYYDFQDLNYSCDDQRFYEHLENLCEREKIEQSPSSGLAIFLLSIGLFAFGKLDAIEDILNNMPSSRHPTRSLVSCFRLLPLPQTLEFDEIRIWVKRKEKYLEWDEAEDRYYLRNFKVLSNTLNSPKFFSDNASSKSNPDSGLTGEVYQENGASWQAQFKPGNSKFSDVYQHPNREKLMVISGGQGYVIEPETQQTTETFGGEITHVIEIIGAHQILFKSGHQFIVYNPQGLLWKQIIPMLHEVRQLGSENRSILTGERRPTADADWQPFWMSTDTGQTHSEEYDFVRIAMQELRIDQRPWWKIW